MNKQLKIELPQEIESGIYANGISVTHADNEFFLDFIRIIPYADNSALGKVVSRIIINPQNAKRVMDALRDNIKKYENDFGEIKV